jgi:hypothetical protein
MLKVAKEQQPYQFQFTCSKSILSEWTKPFNFEWADMLHDKSNYLVVIGYETMVTIGTATKLPGKLYRGTQIAQQGQRSEYNSIALDSFPSYLEC